MIKGLKLKDKKAFAFGCFGWHSESVGIINEALKTAGFDLLSEGIQVNWHPDEFDFKTFIETGKSLV